MVYEATGDLLTCDVDLICHQTNFHGVMGGGVALSIRNKLLSRNMYMEYERICAEQGRELLGTVQYLPAKTRYLIVNCFCQDDRVQDDGGITRYDCMRKCLEQVEAYARQHAYRVALPGFIGCGIAGGDWNTVRQIIDEVFSASSVSLTIVYWSKENSHDANAQGNQRNTTINEKLCSLTCEQADQLSAHLNSVYIRAEEDRQKG